MMISIVRNLRYGWYSGYSYIFISIPTIQKGSIILNQVKGTTSKKLRFM